MSGYVLQEYLDCEKERAQLRAELAAAQAEAARYKALWESVPWYAAKECTDQLFRVRDFQANTREYVRLFREWVYAHAPQRKEPQP